MAIYVSDIPMTFYHIARNAGSAIEGYLLHHYPSAVWVGNKEEKHWTVEEAETYWFAPRDLNQGKKVCVVRNPFDRLVSQYFFLRANPHLKDYRDRDHVLTSFEAWIYNGVWGHAYWPPQHYFIKPCDYVLRYENLKEEFNAAMMQIFGEVHYLPRENGHELYSDEKRKHYTEYYTPEMVEFLINYSNKDRAHATWKVFKNELDALGYQFGD